MRQITIKDIAKMAGVSHSTVSRALNNSGRVGKGTSERIRQIAESLEFEFNSGARSLSSHRTGIIGVIYTTDLDFFGGSLYTNELFLDLRHSLESFDLDSILLAPQNPRTGNSNIKRLIRQKKVDAFLIVHSGISREDYDLIRTNSLPVVQMHMKPAYYPTEDLDLFVADNVAGGRIACDHLLAQGCHRILALTSRHYLRTNMEFQERVEGYARSLENHGITPDPSLVVDVGPSSFEGGYDLVRERPELFAKVDGVFAQADIIALGCLLALKERGAAIPGDIRIIGYDDVSVCGFCQPALSTIHQPREELTRRACERIHSLLDNGGTAHVHETFEPRLVVRGSSSSSDVAS